MPPPPPLPCPPSFSSFYDTRISSLNYKFNNGSLVLALLVLALAKPIYYVISFLTLSFWKSNVEVFEIPTSELQKINSSPSCTEKSAIVAILVVQIRLKKSVMIIFDNIYCIQTSSVSGRNNSFHYREIKAKYI